MKILTLLLISLTGLGAQVTTYGCTPSQTWEEHWGFFFERGTGKLYDNKCEFTGWLFENATLTAPGNFATPQKLMPYAFATQNSAEKIKVIVEKMVLPNVAADLKINIRENLIKSPVFWRDKPERQLCFSKPGAKDFHCSNAGLVISQLIRTPKSMFIVLLSDEIASALERVE